MRIEAWASEQHYWDHLWPVWMALQHHHPNLDLGQANYGGHPQRAPRRDTLWLVASTKDARKVGGRYIYVEHGAGQGYHGDVRGTRSASFAGGPTHERAAGFICPNVQVASRWRARYPDKPAWVVGDSPKMDKLRRHPPQPVWLSDLPTVAFCWHWESQRSPCPEATSAWRHYRDALAALAAEGRWRVLVHAHPRAWTQLEPQLRAMPGLVATPSLDVVWSDAKVVVVDNTSVGPEAASLGKPVVWLTAPWYRRDVHHGGRFWEWPAYGVHVTEPALLAAGVQRALDEPAHFQRLSTKLADLVYPRRDGHSAMRAADAIAAVASQE